MVNPHQGAGLVGATAGGFAAFQLYNQGIIKAPAVGESINLKRLPTRPLVAGGAILGYLTLYAFAKIVRPEPAWHKAQHKAAPASKH